MGNFHRVFRKISHNSKQTASWFARKCTPCLAHTFCSDAANRLVAGNICAETEKAERPIVILPPRCAHLISNATRRSLGLFHFGAPLCTHTRNALTATALLLSGDLINLVFKGAWVHMPAYAGP